MTGFFFADKHSREFWMAMEDASRPLLPELRRNDYEITGRHGTVDFGGETYATRQITVDICFISDNVTNLQETARSISLWLSGSGLLWFDDECHRAYTAKVYMGVDTEQLIRAKRASVVFECQPFARTIHYLQNIHAGVSGGTVIPVESGGTQPTPCLIFVRNTGSTALTNLRITRRALHR